jgi:hypothetical protein
MTKDLEDALHDKLKILDSESDQHKDISELKRQLEKDQELMIELKNQEHEKIRALTAEHRFEMLQMEEKLESAITKAHKLKAEEGEKKREWEREL